MDITVKQCRAESYRLLADCFYTPDGIWLNQENLFGDLAGTLQSICPNAANLSLKMEEIAAQQSVEKLSIEYAKLFVGPYELLAPPYGSVYLDRQQQVMGNSTMAVKNMYQEYGLNIADDFKELPDHIAVELEFMYYLIYKEIEALQLADNGDASTFVQAQKQFVHSFLGKFVFSLCDKIQEESISTFYQALAACVSTFVRNDYNFLWEEKKKGSENLH